MEQASCLIDYEPDISGIGIRISFYLQTVSAPLLIRLTGSKELANSLQSALGFSAISLLLTVIIHTFTEAITLYDALIAFHLICLIGITVQSKYRSSTGVNPLQLFVFACLYYFAALVFIVWSIYVFTNAPSMGLQPDCNHRTIYVLMFVNIRMIGPIFRWIIVAALGIMLLSLIINAGIHLGLLSSISETFQRCGSRKKRSSLAQPETTLSGKNEPVTTHTLEICNCQCADTTRQPGDLIKTRTFQLRKKDINPIIGHILGCAYIITMIELMIARNPKAPVSKAWSFGQVLAVFLLIGPLLELLSYLFDQSATTQEWKKMMSKVVRADTAVESSNGQDS